MRKLQKSEVPTYLKENGDRLRVEYLEAIENSRKPLPRPWRHNELRASLELETGGRCAYCDGDILAVSFGDVEHFRPRVHFPELVVEWHNLTLACQLCNNAKGDKWNPDLPFIDPYTDEVEEHIVFVGALAWGVSYRGVLTVDEIGLNDLGKVESRQRSIDGVMVLYRAWRCAGPAEKTIVELQIRDFIETSPYFAAIVAALRGAGYPVDASESSARSS